MTKTSSSFTSSYFVTILKWLALPALIALVAVFFLLGNNKKGSSCTNCNCSREGMATGSDGVNTGDPGKAGSANLAAKKNGGVVPYVQQDNGGGSPNQQAYRLQQQQQAEQNNNNMSLSDKK